MSYASHIAPSILFPIYHVNFFVIKFCIVLSIYAHLDYFNDKQYV
jgi:hypothetical protein